MTIQFIRDWRGYATGAVVDFDGGVADMLCRRNIAVQRASTLAEARPVQLEVATVGPAEAAATRFSAPRGRRGR